MKWLVLTLLSLLSFSIYSQDLVITSYNGRTTFSQYEEFSETITVKNDGIVPVTRSFGCDIYLSVDSIINTGDIGLGSGSLNSIGAGESLDLRLKNGDFSAPPGNYVFIIKIDQDNYVQETNDQNNRYVVGNIIVKAANIDWQFTSLSVNPPTSLPHMPSDTIFHLHEAAYPLFRIVNTGTTNAADVFYSTYYLSADEVLDGNDKLIGTMSSWLDGPDQITEGSVWPFNGNIFSPNLNFTIPSTLKTGKYYLIGKADSNNGFSETNENNNTFVSAPILIGRSDADLFISEISEASFENGHYLEADYTINNSGTTGVGGYSVNAFLSADAVLDQYDYAFPEDYLNDYDAPYVEQGRDSYARFSARRSQMFEFPAGAYYVILSIEGITETNYNNNVFISPTPLIIISPPPIPEISIASASFTGVYGNTDKSLKLDVNLTNTGPRSNDLFVFDINFKNSTGATVHKTKYYERPDLNDGETRLYTWSFSLPNPLPHGVYNVEITSGTEGYVGPLFTVDLHIDIPTYAIAGTIEGEDGVPINTGKLFLYQKHDDGKISFINKTLFTSSNNFSFLTDYHQHTLFYIPDPKAYSGYVPTILGKTVTLKDNCFFTLKHDVDTVFEVLRVTPLASGKKTISGNVYTDAAPTSRTTGTSAQRIIERTDGEVEGFPIVLMSSTGQPVKVATTDSNGYYEFTGLPDDVYEIVVALELDKPVMQEPVPVDVTKNNAVVDLGVGQEQVEPVVNYSQEITFRSLPQKTFGDAPFEAVVSVSSTLFVTLSSSDPAVARIKNGKIEIVGAGRTTITARQEGAGSYLAAAPVQQELVVKKAQQSLTVAEIPEKTFGNPPFSLQILTNTNAPVTITSSDRSIANVSNNKIYVVRAGTADITVSVDANSNYEAATVVRQVTIRKQDQRIVFEALPEIMLGEKSSLPLVAQATSSLPVSFVSDNEAVASIDANNVLTVKGAGVANITAIQEGNFNFTAAFSVSRVLKVNLISGIEQRTQSFKAFPNPVTGLLTIEGVYPVKSVAITDACGRSLANISWHENTIDLRAVSPGIYLVKVESMGGPEVLRVIKK